VILKSESNSSMSSFFQKTRQITSVCRIATRVCFIALIILAPSGLCAAQVINPQGQEIQEHLRLAQKALAEDSPDAATREFDAILAIDKNNPTALANLGALAFVRGDWSAAAARFTQALQVVPSLSKAQGLLAICKRRLGDPTAQAALEAAFPVIEDKRIHVQVGMELADVYRSQEKLEQAASTLGALLQIVPDNVDVLFVAQQIYQQMAAGTLDKLAVLAPASARMQQVIAEHLINVGNLSGAIEHYRAALKLNPKLPGVHYEIGESIMQSSIAEGSLAEAEEEFAEALRVDGESAEIETKLGMIAGFRARQDLAFDHYSRAYNLNPRNLEAQLGMAKILVLREEPKKALPYLRTVVDADPMNVEARYRYAAVCKQLGLMAEANRQLALFREAKAVKAQVEDVYSQMNRPPVKRADDSPYGDK
jgi:tetratricopeptide (TPR) repeat protein